MLLQCVFPADRSLNQAPSIDCKYDQIIGRQKFLLPTNTATQIGPDPVGK